MKQNKCLIPVGQVNAGDLTDMESFAIEEIEKNLKLFKKLETYGYKYAFWISHADVFNNSLKSWSLINFTKDEVQDLLDSRLYQNLLAFLDELTTRFSDGEYKVQLVNREGDVVLNFEDEETS